MSERIVHCWESGPRDWRCGTTCLLPDGHDGPHEWTRDDEIEITFHDAAPTAAAPPMDEGA
jgi:hypothetical protein